MLLVCRVSVGPGKELVFTHCPTAAPFMFLFVRQVRASLPGILAAHIPVQAVPCGRLQQCGSPGWGHRAVAWQLCCSLAQACLGARAAVPEPTPCAVPTQVRPLLWAQQMEAKPFSRAQPGSCCRTTVLASVAHVVPWRSLQSDGSSVASVGVLSPRNPGGGVRRMYIVSCTFVYGEEKKNNPVCVFNPSVGD